jgi:hypothetical protein
MSHISTGALVKQAFNVSDCGFVIRYTAFASTPCSHSRGWTSTACQCHEFFPLKMIVNSSDEKHQARTAMAQDKSIAQVQVNIKNRIPDKEHVSVSHRYPYPYSSSNSIRQHYRRSCCHRTTTPPATTAISISTTVKPIFHQCCSV